MDQQKILSLFKKINYNTEDNEDGKNYRYFHPLRVLKMSLFIIGRSGLVKKINKDVVFVLALFHDLGRNEKLIRENGLINSKKNFDRNNLFLFKKYINSKLENKDTINYLEKVTQDFSLKKYKFWESKIVRDADNLDEIGVLNFWRMANYAGKHKQDIKEIIDYYYGFDRNDKIRKTKNFFIPFSKKIAKWRMKEMDAIMKKFKKANNVE